MRKPVLIGAGLGLIVLLILLVIFSKWPSAEIPYKTSEVRGETSSSGVAQQGEPVIQRMDRTSEVPIHEPILDKQERRKRLADLRAELNGMGVQGVQVTPEKMERIVNDLEALSPAGMDPLYFQSLRNVLVANAQIQQLNSELQALSKTTSPENSARQEEIIAEIRALGERLALQASQMQAHVPRVSSP